MRHYKPIKRQLAKRDLMDMNLRKLQKIVKDREAWRAAVHVTADSGHNLATEQQSPPSHTNNNNNKRTLKWGGSNISLELHGACLDHFKGKGSPLEQLLLRERTEHLKSQREVRCWEEAPSGRNQGLPQPKKLTLPERLLHATQTIFFRTFTTRKLGGDYSHPVEGWRN